MLYAYDLDDTLADTKLAVIRAYEQAGITPPEEFWGQPWQAWLEDESIHARKIQIYPGIVRRYVKPLPLADLFRQTGGYILTGASIESAQAVTEHLNLQPIALMCNLDADGKALILNSLAETGIYFDDHLPTCRTVEEKTGWTPVHVLRP